jgi:putative ABC transport system substrate-binding protein
MVRSRRRQFLIGASALLAMPSVAEAQSRGRVRTVGQLITWSAPPADSPFFRQIRQAVIERYKELRWVVGQDVTLHPLYADFDASRLPGMAKQLVDERVDVIWVSTTAAAVAAMRATTKIPIVLAGACAYPVECGVIKSFAHPGGNVTGVAFFQGIEVQSKLAQYVREILPDAKRLAWLAFPPDLVKVAGGYFRPEPYYQKVARNLGFELGYYECRKVEDFEPAFAAMRAWGAQALIVEPAALTALGPAQRIAHLNTQSRLPSFFSVGGNVQLGGLLSYGPVLSSVYEETVSYVDRILRGARPSDLPVEMPSKLELVVNQKTAQALGLTIPPSLLLQADRVIE